MNRYLSFSILFLLIVYKLGNVNGYANYKWVPLKAGDTLPENIVLIDRSGRYIGRARHFEEILPAEITQNGSAIISSCHEQIWKEQSEILTISEEHIWNLYRDFKDIDDTILRVGTALNGEPIYIGLCDSYYYPDDNHITSIYLSKNVLYTWGNQVGSNLFNNPTKDYFSYKSKTKWVDSSAAELPNNTVSGGKSKYNNNYEMYVAKLKWHCEAVTGQVIPEKGIATAILDDGRAVEAFYFQVLVGEPNEYTWVSASDGEIPDFAVSNGKHGIEVAYIARVNNTIRGLTHSEALYRKMDYDILVTN